MSVKSGLASFGGRAAHPDNGRWLIYGLLGIVLWLAARGRLAAVVSAMETPAAGTDAQGNPAPSDTGASSFGDWTAPAGFPDPHQFLNTAPTGEASGFSVDGVQSLDSQGIQAEGGLYAYADWDYAVPANTPVHLPGGKDTTYTVLPTNWGDPHRTAVVRVESGPGQGGIIEFLHLNADYLTPGATVHGGDALGLSGFPQGAYERGSGDHLAVIPDPVAGRWLSTL